MYVCICVVVRLLLSASTVHHAHHLAAIRKRCESDVLGLLKEHRDAALAASSEVLANSTATTMSTTMSTSASASASPVKPRRSSFTDVLFGSSKKSSSSSAASASTSSGKSKTLSSTPSSSSARGDRMETDFDSLDAMERQLESHDESAEAGGPTGGKASRFMA